MWELKVVNKIRRSRFEVITLGAFLLLGLSFSSAHARTRSQQKTVGELLKSIEKNTKSVEIKKGRSSLPTFSPLRKSKTIDLKTVQPPSRAKLYYDADTNEGELEKVTDEGINQLYKLTQQFKTSQRRGELWLRLAELYVEKARLIEYQIQNNYDKALQDYRQKKLKKKPVLTLTPAQVYNKKAIQLYEWFLRDFPKDEKVPQALFFLGYNYFELGQESKGSIYYERLTKMFPNSPFVDESSFALGEHYFDQGQFQKALGHYAKVAKNPKARLYSFALYKAAWCQYKLGKVKDALRSLEFVIRAGREAKGQEDRSTGGASRIRLASEAVKDLVIFYAEVGTAEQALAYFDRVVGPRNTPKLIEKLAYYYVDTGNKEGARYLFKGLIAGAPTAAKAYDYQYQIVSMYIGTASSKVFRLELYQWIESYGPESVWARANSKELKDKAGQLIEATLRNYILQQHQTAQNSRAEFSQSLARSGYELYFTTFKDSPRLDEMHFFYAELLFDMKEWERAAYHYLWVTEKAPKSQYVEKASLNALLALEKKLPTPEEIKKNVGENMEPVEFEKPIKLFERTAVTYINAYPKSENVIPIKYKLGSLYYYYNQYDRALAVFNEIVEKYPGSKEAEYSANLILDIYNIKKDFDGLQKAGQKILSIPALAKSSAGAQIRGIVQRASFKKAQGLESDKDYMSSAKSYQKFASENPNSDLAVSAYYNAGVNYERAGDIFSALGMYAIVAGSRSKQHEGLVKNTTKFMAALYEKTGQYQKAAEAFQAYADKNQKDKEAVDFYYNAAVIQDGMKHYDSALRNYQKYYDMSRKLERVEVIFLMGQIWEKRGNLKKALAQYERYMNSNPMDPATVVEAAFLIAEISEKLGRRKQSDEWYGKTIATQRRLAAQGKNVGVGRAAESKFKLVYKTYEELRAVKIPANPSDQAAAVNKKLNILNRLKEELKAVIKYDDANQIVAALTLTGQSYQHMAASIYNAPLPKGLDADGLKQYREGVEKIATPFQEEAVKSYLEALEKGSRLEGYNTWLKIAKKELNTLDKEKYPDFDEEVFSVKIPDTMGI